MKEIGRDEVMKEGRREVMKEIGREEVMKEGGREEGGT